MKALLQSVGLLAVTLAMLVDVFDLREHLNVPAGSLTTTAADSPDVDVIPPAVSVEPAIPSETAIENHPEAETITTSTIEDDIDTVDFFDAPTVQPVRSADPIYTQAPLRKRHFSPAQVSLP